MTEEQVQQFFKRIDTLTTSHEPLFGKMNVNQMVCHCANQLRVAMGIKEIKNYKMISPEEVIALSKAKKTVPTPKEMNQVKGYGTKPSGLENDKKILKDFILKFSKLNSNFDLSPHPYFGKIDKKKWTEITLYHFNHHLRQFNA